MQSDMAQGLQDIGCLRTRKKADKRNPPMGKTKKKDKQQLKK
jgi:hypothetical protein